MVCREEPKLRTILHSDLNNFYASVEVLKNPDLKDKPVAVCGSQEDRHGIVLAKNQIAKEYNVKTGEAIWEAKKKCPNLVTVPVDFASYIKVSQRVREIYSRFTDRIEPFGIDECWLDVTDSIKNFGTGEQIADRIRKIVKEEIGVTVSVGVSFNKVFAKLGSDMKKPDATTIISIDNYKETVWKLPVEDLLYVGRATKKKLNSVGIYTIGDLATFDQKILEKLLGVWGKNLYINANGKDTSPVLTKSESGSVKSIGNSMTDYKDLWNFDQVKTLLLLLSESVAARLRESGLGRAKTIKVSVTDSTLKSYGKQLTLSHPTKSAGEIAKVAYSLFQSLYDWKNPVRGAGVSLSNFTMGLEQLSFDIDQEKEKKQDRLDSAIDKIRAKYGNTMVQRARILTDEKLAHTDIKGDHLISASENIEDNFD